MERLDFCSVTGIIREYCNEEKLGAQLNFVEKLFYTCVYGEDEDTIYFDETQVCRWLKGQVNLSRTIISYYINSSKHQQALKDDISNGIVSILYDKEMAEFNRDCVKDELEYKKILRGSDKLSYDTEYYETLRAKGEEQAAYNDFIASLDMND